MVYSYVGITQDSKIRVLDVWVDVELGKCLKMFLHVLLFSLVGGLKRFTSLNIQNPKIKTLVELRDWNECSSAFWTLISSPSRRTTFIQSVITFLQTYGFDGIVLNLQYLPEQGAPPTAKVSS